MFVKICGITNENDALLGVAVDADALGFVLAPSPRQVDPETVRDIVRRLPREVHTVGVFRNERRERVAEIVARAGLHGAQLHGDESAEDVAWVRERTGFVIRAFPAGHPALADAASLAADIILIDSPSPGSGKVFDWQLADGAPVGKRMLLAGGLTPDNVAQAVKLVRPWGVDVSTGVEEKPGRKDSTKMREFVAAARAAGDELEDHRTIDLTIDENVPGVTRPWDWEVDS